MKIGITKNGKPAFLNEKKLTNKHIAITGESGSGKTVLSQYLMTEEIKNGGTVIALDMHGTLADDQIYGAFSEFFKDNINNIEAHDDGITCAMFSPMRYPDGSYESPIDTVGAVTNSIAEAFGAGCRQKAGLRKAVEYMYDTHAYEREGIQALDKALLESRCKGSIEIADKLYFMTQHNIFKHGDEFIKKNKINIFRLSKFDLDTQIQISELILAYVWRLANVDTFKNDNVMLFIDEAQNMPSGKRSTLATLISEGRKFGINLLLASQMILQSSTDAVQQRISQCGTMVFFRPASDRVALTANMIDASKKDIYVRLLRHLGVGEFIAVGDFIIDDMEIDNAIQMRTVVNISEEGSEEA